MERRIPGGSRGLFDRTAALEQLCRSYWYPTYAFLRRWGRGQEEAKDLTQGFFAHFLAKDLCREAAPKMDGFVRSCWRRSRISCAMKSAGNTPKNEADRPKCCRWMRNWPKGVTPWNQRTRRHRRDCLNVAGRGKSCAKRCIVSKRTTSAPAGEADYAKLAAALNKNEGAVRTAVSRLRHQFREAIRQAVADTVANPAQVDAELQQLKEILRNE